MSHEFENEDSVDPVEQTLASFIPAAPRLDRDRLMFLAGAASDQGYVQTRQGPHWLWPASSGTLAATSLALAIALFMRPTPSTQYIVNGAPGPMQPAQHPTEFVAAEQQPQESPRYVAARPKPQPVVGDSYIKTREVALRMGLDALGSPSSGGSGLGSGATYLQLLEGLAGGSSLGQATGATERLPNL